MGQDRGWRSRSRRSQDPPDSDWPQFHRRLSPHRALPQPSLPFIPGSEAAGVITAVGPGVRDLKVGRHVAYAGIIGAYTEERLIPADRVVKIPKGISDEFAASIMLKGMTAQYLLRRTYKVSRDTTILFHAAAGGVGLIACQW